MAYIYGKTTYAKLYNATYNVYEVRVGYELVSQSQDDNTSRVNARLQVRTTDSTYVTYGYKQTSTLGGIKSSAKSFSVREEDVWVTFATQTLTLQHNEDGSYNGTITGSFTTNIDTKWGLLSGSASVTTDLPVIPRYTTIESVEGDLLGSTVTVTLSRKEDTYKHDVEYSFEGSEYVLAGSEIDTSCAFVPSLELASQIKDKTSGTLTIRVSTYSNGEKIQETKPTTTLSIPDDVIPTIDEVTVTSASNVIPSEWGVLVKDNSQAMFTIVASGIYESTIKSYAIVGTNISYNGESNTFTSELLGVAGTLAVVVTVTDSRGRQATTTVPVTVVDYEKPSISAVIKRCNEDGTVNPSGSYLSIVSTYTYASIDGHNTHEKSVSINGSTATDFENGEEYILNANLSPSESYTATFIISDSLGNASTVSYLSRKDTRVFNITKKKDGIAFNGFAESGKFKNNYPTDFMQDYACPIGQVLITSTPTSPSIGEWELIDKEFIPQLVSSDNFTLTTANTTSATLTVILGGHDIDVKLTTVNKTAIGEDEKKRGTIILSAIGVTSLPMGKGQVLGASDGGNAWSSWTITADGSVSTVDCDPSSSSVPAGSTNIVHWHYTVGDFTTMIDDFCNKFYWKRIV